MMSKYDQSFLDMSLDILTSKHSQNLFLKNRRVSIYFLSLALTVISYF